MISFSVVLFLISIIMFFVSTFFYIFSLLTISLLSLVILYSSGFISSLLSILFYVVYVGAIIVLIGYVCAVCPNVLFSYNLSFASFLAVLFVTLSSSFLGFYSFDTSFNTSVLTSLYSSSNIYLFISIVLMLFLVLLMVTTQHLLPNGPFRSVS